MPELTLKSPFANIKNTFLPKQHVWFIDVHTFIRMNLGHCTGFFKVSYNVIIENLEPLNVFPGG